MGIGDWFDDPALPQDPLGSALGKWTASKVADVSPLFTPERMVQFAKTPSRWAAIRQWSAR